MKIWRITFTGADDNTSQAQMLSLSKEWVCLEWAILFSQSKAGVPRYPSLDWVETLPEMTLAAHLCGKWVSDALKGILTFDDKRFKRIQLNLGKDRLRSALKSEKLTQAIAGALARTPELQNVILGGNYDGVTTVPRSKFDVLFDASGGHGKSPESWPNMFDGVSCGYAGGLRPENLEEQLHKMDEVVGNRHIWIDMESGVRTEDEFDLEKVKQCLEIAKPWLL